MAEKYNTILRLAEDTEKNVISSREEWFRFLNSAGRFCKYPFREQLLIYAQRPDASACAPITVWDSMGCWINRGAKGIALIDTASPRPKLRYVFDMADVTPEKEKNGRLPYLWSVKPEHEQAVMDALEAVYGKTDARYPFKDRIVELVMEAAKGCYEDVAGRLSPYAAGSRLEGMESRKLALTVLETIAESAMCAVINACGIEQELKEYSFSSIGKFNTHDTLLMIGDAANALARPIVAEIGRAVRGYERQKEAEKSLQEHGGEKNIPQAQKNLAVTSERGYNALKRESRVHGIEKENGDKERGAENGTGIQMGRGLPDTGYRNGRTAGRGAAEVRPAAEKIPAGEQRGAVLDTPVQKRTDGPPVYNPGTGRGAVGADHRADGGRHGSGRSPQGEGPDALGAENEQHQAFGRGNSAGGDDLYLDDNNVIQPDADENSDGGHALQPEEENANDNHAQQPDTGKKEPDNGGAPLSGSFSQGQTGAGGAYEQMDLFSMFAGQAGSAGTNSMDENGRLFSAYKRKFPLNR